MTDQPRRSGDPQDYDPRPYRDRDEVKVGWGDKAVHLRGPMVIVAVLLITLGGVTFYFHDIQAKGHDVLAKRIEMQTCILSLTQEERVELRASLAGIRKLDTADFFIRSWCPWIGQ